MYMDKMITGSVTKGQLGTRPITKVIVSRSARIITILIIFEMRRKIYVDGKSTKSEIKKLFQGY